jgi:hypothetical protein
VVVLGGRSESGQRGSALVFTSGIQAADPDDEITQGSQVIRSVSGADSGAIFAEGDVTDVVDRIFNAPVTPAKGLDLSGAHFRGWTTGQEDLGFLGDAQAFEMMSGAADHRCLGGMGKARVLRSDFEGIDLASFMPAVALVQSDIRRGKKNPPGL